MQSNNNEACTLLIDTLDLFTLIETNKLNSELSSHSKRYIPCMHVPHCETRLHETFNPGWNLD